MGIVMGAAYALVVALLSVQAIGVESGGVFDLWSNEVIGIVSPGVPILQVACIGLASAVVIAVLTVGAVNWRRAPGVSLIASFGLFIVGVVVLGVILEVDASDVPTERPVALGLAGWLRQFAFEGASYAVIFSAAVLFVIAMRSRKPEAVEHAR